LNNGTAHFRLDLGARSVGNRGLDSGTPHCGARHGTVSCDEPPPRLGAGIAQSKEIDDEWLHEEQGDATVARRSCSQVDGDADTAPVEKAEPDAEMSAKQYAKALKKLHVELVKLQLWVAHTGAKICIVFEGRDGAGKGGTIKAITERVSPRVFRVIALPAPTEREKSQMYMQRYLQHLPAAGEVVIFDRSWYNRAGVEPVMGFCTPQQTERFLKTVPLMERAIVQSGVILLKYWLEVSPRNRRAA
jgi:polyphosphate kinase 2 (PPK2 family)